MRIGLPYGASSLEADLDWGRFLGALDVADSPGLADPDAETRQAIANPIGMKAGLLAEFSEGDTVAVVVSDAFRQTGMERVLPVLIDELGRAGTADKDILFIFATGTHRAPTAEEQKRILGTEVYARFHDRLHVHDPEDRANLVYVGTTPRGTRVEVNRRARESDHIIATGATVLHYFGGFGGGRKSIMPGICSVESISQNHSLNLAPDGDGLDPDVRIGRLDGNPVAEDMLDATRLVGVDGIVNTVLNRRGEIAGIFAGELDEAHRAAARFARSLFAVKIAERADLVIAASGGARNFVQTHKALFNAFQALKPGGRIVLAAPCPEGLGGEPFVKWLRLGSREAIIAGLRQRSEINGQTALSTIEKAPSALLVTEMSAREVDLLGARRVDSLDDALELARLELARAGVASPTYYLMPNAAYTAPFVEA